MTLTLQNSANFSQTYTQYVPLFAGLGQEPAVTIASMIRSSILNPPLTWFFNRGEITPFNTVIGQQDYTVVVSDLAFVEKVTLTDDQGNVEQLKDIYNNAALSKSAVQQRPSSMSVESVSIAAGVWTFTFRFLGVPDKIYAVNAVYQKRSPIFGPFFITSAANAVGANTTYTGSFDALSFPVGSTAVITGFKANAVNNGSFTVVSCNSTTLVVANAAGVAETISAFANNFDWAPIPDSYSDVYNNLFLSEILAMVDDARATVYRQRGVAALLAKASGLTEMQKNAWVQQWLARDIQRQSALGAAQQGQGARGI